MQDPELYLAAIGVTLPCPVHRDRDAVLDADHRLRIGHESFFFSSQTARDEFRRRPLRYIDRLTDPVTDVRFIPTDHSPRFEHEGRSYYFSGENSLNTFQSDPNRYADARREMR